MRKLATFLHVFINSLIPLDSYYKKLKTTPLQFSLKYFFTLMFLVSVLSGVIISHKLIISKDTWRVSQEINSILDSYPSDLIIRIKDGTLMTSLDRPYIIFMNFEDIPRPILVIDEFATPLKRDLYRTPILLTSSAMVVNFDNTTQVIRFDPSLDVNISKKNVDLVKNRLKITTFFLPAILMLLLIFFVTIYFIFNLVVALILLLALSVIYFLIARHLIHSLTFKKTWQISLHAASVPILLGTLISLTRLQSPNPLMIPFVYVLFVGAALYEVYFDRPKR